MSNPTPRRVSCGAVAVRPAEEIRAELERACQQDRRVIATPIQQPALGTPVKFYIIRRPPLPAPPPRRAHDDDGPAASTAERRTATADIAARVDREVEAAIAPLRRIASMSAAPRPAAPEDETEDHYDLRRWRRWSAKWD